MDTKVIKPWILFVLLLVLPHYGASLSGFGDTLLAGQSLSESESIISKAGNFELGFFKRGNSSRIYLGIWYKRFVKDIVWVANRESPLSDPSSLRLKLSEDGNLVLLEDSSNITFWSTNLTSSASNLTEAVLGDDGNFVLKDRTNPASIFWESFDHPTDTWLPGGKLGIDKVTGKPQQLISWKNSQDPAPGLFSLGLDPNGSNQFFLEWNRSQIYWSSGVWNGRILSSIPEMKLNYVFNFSFVPKEKGRYFTYSLYDNSTRSKFAITNFGQIQEVVWSFSGWNLFWNQPRQLSDVYALCGAFGAYRENSTKPCECLHGFEPFSMQENLLNDSSGGCVRKSPLQCENSTYANGGKDWFLKMPNVRLPVNSIVHSAVSARNCEGACMNNCSCTAYAYNSSGCIIWQGGLLNLQQLSDGDNTGQDIFMRLAAAEKPRTKGKTWKVRVTVAAMVSSTGLILCLSIYFSRKGKLRSRGDKPSSENLFLHDFNIELHAMDDGMNSNNHLKNGERKDVELPIFSYESVSKTTNNFSAANKLGEGGFGPVYKGTLFKGQEIAVKMLSKRSGQGIQEFRNEIILIAKLQHRNLVKLLGYCIEGEEKILIYEYMPNKSLDHYLFGT